MALGNAARHLLIAGAIAFAAISCSKSNPGAPSPTPQPGGNCTFSVGDGPASSVPSDGTEFTVSIATQAGCAWSASSSATFVSVMGAASGTGDGSVRFAVQANTGQARQGSVLVANRALTINQSAPAAPPPPEPGPPAPAPPTPPPPPPGCAFSLSPAQNLVQPPGGTLTVTVTQTQGTNCAWTATSNASFITITSGASGTGNGFVVLSVASNPGSQRNGTVSIGGHTFTVFQETSCVLQLSGFNFNVPASGGTVTVNVSFSGGTSCAWNAVSQNPLFMTVSGGNNTVIGAGSFTITVAPNTGLGRQGSVNVTSTPYAYAVNIFQAANAPAQGAVAVLRYQSDLGEYVGGGGSNSFTLASSEFTAVAGSSGSDMQFNMLLPGFWNVVLRAPSGQQLAPGLYNNIGASPLPGLAVSGNHNGCGSGTTGHFLISEAVFGPNQTVQRLHAKFQQHCNNVSPGLRGELWIDAQGSTTPPPMADLPAGPSSPTTFFSYTSDAGHTLTQGGSGNDTIPAAKFHAQDSGTNVIVTVSDPGNPTSYWQLRFDAVAHPFNFGVYNATGVAGAPTINVVRSGNNCSATGKFEVLDLVRGPSGEVLRLNVKFEHRCGSNPATMRGEVYLVANPWK